MKKSRTRCRMARRYGWLGLRFRSQLRRRMDEKKEKSVADQEICRLRVPLAGKKKTQHHHKVLEKRPPHGFGSHVPLGPHENIVEFLDEEPTGADSKSAVDMFSEKLFQDLCEKDSTGHFSIQPFSLHKLLVGKLNALGYSRMTKIQTLTLPKVLEGCDVLIRSETGSGKSLAFLVPAVQLLIAEDQVCPLQRSMGTRVLIIAPTRELVCQTMQLADRLTTCFPRVVTASLTGGEKRKSEKGRLRKGVALLGATVGRLCDHLFMTQCFHVTHLKLFILDEADRLLDMGFEKKLKWIVMRIREAKDTSLNGGCTAVASFKGSKKEDTGFQSILVSATLVPSIKKLANFLLRPSRSVWISNAEEPSAHPPPVDGPTDGDQKSGYPALHSIPETIDQYYTVVTLKTKLVLLTSVFLSQTQKHGKVVVFCSNSDLVEYYFALFQTLRWPNENAFQRSVGQGYDSFRCVEGSHGSKRSWWRSDTAEDVNGPRRLDDKSRTQHNLVILQKQLGETILSPHLRFFKLHGHLSQVDRIGFLTSFNECRSGAVLFTTDVAARGLNFLQTPFILQCEAPQELSDYVHRVGRTGRLQEKVKHLNDLVDFVLDGGRISCGCALLLMLEHEKGYLDYLQQGNILLKHHVELDLFQPLLQDYLPEFLKRKRLENPVVYLSSFFCRQVEADLDLLHLARRAFTGCYRAYRCYAKELKPFFNIKAVHWGHQATSLGLSEAPSHIGQKCREGALSQQGLRKAKAVPVNHPLHTQYESVEKKSFGKDKKKRTCPLRDGKTSKRREQDTSEHASFEIVRHAPGGRSFSSDTTAVPQITLSLEKSLGSLNKSLRQATDMRLTVKAALDKVKKLSQLTGKKPSRGRGRVEPIH